MESQKKDCISTAALKSGFSRASAYRLRADPQLPSARQTSRTRRRADPLQGIFDEQVVPMLMRHPHLRAVAIFNEVKRRNPQLNPNVRRTLERRIRDWRAKYGPNKEIFFDQRYEPGQQGIFDFTSGRVFDVTIAGEPLDHMLFHFRLRWSGFTHANVVLGGESFDALGEGLQDALWIVGGAPKECRSDSLSAAFRNLDKAAAKDVTHRYETLCKHYNMKPTRNNRGAAHENGAIESPHGHLKAHIKDALTLRSSCEFDSLEDYDSFIAQQVGQINAQRSQEIDAERQVLQPLPQRRTDGWLDATVRVTRNGGFRLNKVFYTVPSRLVGHQLQVRIFAQHLELYLSGSYQLSVPRMARTDHGPQQHVINYRHVIHALKCKPMALLRWTYRAEFFPREEYRLCFEKALEDTDERSACRLAVKLLALAHERGCEAQLAQQIQLCLDRRQLPDIEVMRALFEVDHGAVPKITVAPVSLSSYALLTGGRS